MNVQTILSNKLKRTRRAGWAACILLFTISATGCASLPARSAIEDPIPVVNVIADEVPADEELATLVATMRNDLSFYKARERERMAVSPSSASREGRAVPPRLKEFQSESRTTRIIIPVVGLTANDLDDNWGEPRDGGRRSHRGIDIFAPKGRGIVAVTDGFISFIGAQPKGGNCLWLVNEEGMSFYYAHLERWAPGIYEGMEVKAGDLIGFVGNSGNASRTSPHLHFAIHQDDDAVNPYPLLRFGVISRSAVTLHGGFGRGSR